MDMKTVIEDIVAEEKEAERLQKYGDDSLGVVFMRGLQKFNSHDGFFRAEQNRAKSAARWTGLALLKVSKFQNEFMKSWFLPKYEQKIVRISALCSEGRNLDNFSFVFWEKR